MPESVMKLDESRPVAGTFTTATWDCTGASNVKSNERSVPTVDETVM